MNNKIVKSPVTTKRDRINLPDKIKVVISSKAYAQISYLLQKINDVEWSAILLYTVDGHITTPSKMVCKVDSLYLMDKGSNTYTGHKYDVDYVVDMFEEYPEYMNMKIGHIHSHAGFDAFFSEIDFKELSSNTENHLYYLSLVVNNKGKFIAKLTYNGKQKVKVSVKNKLGKWVWSKNTKPLEKEVIFVHDCDVVTEMVDGTKFINRCEKVINKCSEKKVKTNLSDSLTKYKSTIQTKSNNLENKYCDWGSFDYKLPTKDTTTKFDNSVLKRNLLAKALITCDINNKVGSLSSIADREEKSYIEFNDDDIKESYFNFYTEYNPNFLTEAFEEIYEENDATQVWDYFVVELEKAANLIPGRIGDSIREAIDDILIEWETIRTEEEFNEETAFDDVN